MNDSNLLRLIRLLSVALLFPFLLSGCGILQRGIGIGTGVESDVSRHNRHEIMLVASADGFVDSYSFNPTTLTAEHTERFSTAAPADMLLNRTDEVLYIVNNTRDNATVTSARFNKRTGEMSAMNQSYVLGEGPAAMDLFGGKLVVANEKDGSITLLTLDQMDGILQQADWRIDLGDTGVSKPTDVTFSKDGAHLYVVDKGQDKIFHFRSHRTNPPLTIDDRHITLPEGSNPLSLIFDYSGKHAYLLCEKDAEVLHFTYRSGTLEQVKNHTIKGGTGLRGSAIALTPSGNTLYVAHSGSTTGITIYNKNSDTGALRKSEMIKTAGRPTRIELSQNGRFLALAFEGSSKVDIYKVDQSTGRLTKTSATLHVNTPVDLLWRSFLH